MNKIIDKFTDEYNNSVFSAYLSLVPAEKRQKRLHRHTDFEISLILSGSGVYDTENGECAFTEGDVFLFSANEQHCITEIRDGGLTILNLHFAPPFIYSGDGSKNHAFMNVFFNRADNFKNMLDNKNPAISVVREKFFKIKKECEEKEPCYKLEVKNLLVSVLVTVLRQFDCANLTEPCGKVYDDMNGLKKAMVYIDDNFSDEIRLADIASAACLSKFHFMRLFKASYNMTVWDYINIKRTDKAVNLLLSTSDTVISIGLKCGFNTPANFNRIFKKITGVTPKDCRKRKGDGTSESPRIVR